MSSFCTTGWLVATSSRPNAPSTLHIARAPNSTAQQLLGWQPVAAADGVAFDSRVEAALEDIQTETLEVGSLRPCLSHLALRTPQQSL